MIRNSFSVLVVKEKEETLEDMLDGVQLFLSDYFKRYYEEEGSSCIVLSGKEKPDDMTALITGWNDWAVNTIQNESANLAHISSENELFEKAKAAESLLNALHFLNNTIAIDADFPVYIDKHDLLMSWMHDKQYFLDHLSDVYEIEVEF